MGVAGVTRASRMVPVEPVLGRGVTLASSMVPVGASAGTRGDFGVEYGAG